MSASTPPPQQAPERAPRCALVGMPGAGKSTVGRQLAQRMGVPFVDLDHHLEKQLGCSIRQFFEAEGEESYLFEEPVSLNAMTLLRSLRESGVKAVKIEGRQRGKAYVSRVARAFRGAGPTRSKTDCNRFAPAPVHRLNGQPARLDGDPEPCNSST